MVLKPLPYGLVILQKFENDVKMYGTQAYRHCKQTRGGPMSRFSTS